MEKMSVATRIRALGERAAGAHSPDCEDLLAIAAELDALESALREKDERIAELEADLHDFNFVLEQVPKVYMAITDGRMSKPNYYAADVIAEYEEVLEERINEALREAQQP